MALTPAQRKLRAQIAAHSRVAQTDDTAAMTAPARKAFLGGFEKQVDPDGTLDPAEHARRAQAARSAHFARLALKSSQTRRARKAEAANADQADADVQMAEVGPEAGA